MITNPQHALTFGPLNLIGTPAELASNGYRFEALGDDTDWGNPVPIEQKITSWLKDGALVALLGYDNRDMFIRVRVKGTDGNKLALGEQALMLQVGKRNTLVWTPPDGVGEPCVFSVVTSHLEHVPDDLGDLHLERVYGLRITAEPFVRSQNLITVTQAAPPGGGAVVTLIDDCTSTTGWTGTPNAPSTFEGAVVELDGSAPTGDVLTLKRSGLSISMTSSPYLRVERDVQLLGGNSATVTVKANNVTLVQVGQAGSVCWYDYGGSAAGGSNLNTVEVIATITAGGGGDPAALSVRDLSRSNIPSDPGSTTRQLARTLPIEGSARAQASLAIVDATNALGTVLAYTCPLTDGMVQPPLRALTASGPSTTPDSSTVSGATSDLATLHAFDVPESGLVPGGYLLLARVKHASSNTYTLTWAARSRQGTANLGDAQTGTTDVALAAGVYKVVTVASLNLPPRRIGSSGKVRIELSGPFGVTLDEAWLFNIETGRLSIVECGTSSPAAGGSANRLWLDAPTIEDPAHTIWLGTAADRSDSFHAGSEMTSMGEHEFKPEAVNVFTVTTNSTASSVTLSYYPAGHTHVAAAA